MAACGLVVYVAAVKSKLADLKNEYNFNTEYKNNYLFIWAIILLPDKGATLINQTFVCFSSYIIY